jgi:hypothetical protein
MASPTVPRSARPGSAPARTGCLGRLLGLLGLGLLVGLGAWAWDALIEAPWAHSLRGVVGQEVDGRGTLTGPWLGEFTSPGGRLRGVLALQIERRQWGSAGRTRGVTGPSDPDFAGTARLCGLSAGPDTTGPRELWGHASRDGSRVHVVLSLAPGREWTLGALDGAWNRQAGTLTLAGKLGHHGATRSGGAADDDHQATTITLTRSTGRDAFEQRCLARGLIRPP